MESNELDHGLLNLVGEYRVCSELAKAGILPSLTYGNCKSADIYAVRKSDSKALRIEVKTSQGKKFLTGLNRKRVKPDFWVLVHVGAEVECFVLTHKELVAAQEKRYAARAKKLACRGKSFDPMTGVDSVLVGDMKPLDEGNWGKIMDVLKAGKLGTSRERGKAKRLPKMQEKMGELKKRLSEQGIDVKDLR